jgi:branched-subunit amino acid aminotransferase/4-amino-4-deoxychorismate lyase
MVYLNGAILPSREAMISPLDRGFLYGDGLFETMRSYGGKIHLLARHLARLRRSADHLLLPLPSDQDLVTALRATLEANGGGDLALRLTVSRGTGAIGDISGDMPTLLVTPRPLTQRDGRPEALITLSVWRSPPETGMAVKSLNYLTGAQAARELADAGVGEGILLTHEGWVAEGSVSNIFALRDDLLRTPPLSLGILDGITRRRVMELAGTIGIEVREERFTPEFLRSCRECFYTNSVREVVPVSSVDGHRVGDGDVGPVTRKLLDAYRREAPDEWM